MSDRLRRLAIVVAAGLVGGTLGAAGVVPALADHGGEHFEFQFQVNVLRDAVDGNIGDGICSTGVTLPNDEPECTLRAAVQELNALHDALFDPESQDWWDAEIHLMQGTEEEPAVHVLDIQGAGEDEAATGDLDITGDVRIMGGNEAGWNWDDDTDEEIFEVTDISVIDASALDDRALDVLGGGDDWWYGRLRIDGATIFGGTAPEDEDGGGVRVQNGGQADIYNGAAIRESAAHDGGGVWIGRDSYIYTEDALLEGNTAERDGGGIWFAGDWTSSQLDDIYVRSNTAARYGGGLFTIVGPSGYSWRSEWYVRGQFEDNRAGERGGGAFVTGHSNTTVVVEDSTFLRNSAGRGGGVWVGGVATLDADVDFDYWGGVLRTWDVPTMRVLYTDFAQNLALRWFDSYGDDYSGRGGAIAAEHGVLHIQHSEIIDNASTNGGGVSVSESGTLFAHDVLVRGNSAGEEVYDEEWDEYYSIGGEGGGLWLDNPSGSTHYLRDVQIIENDAHAVSNPGDGRGGGIYAAGPVDLGWSTIALNTASGDAGGLYDGLCCSRIVNSTISGNVAGGQGGGVAANDSEDPTTILHSTITQNTAAYGAGVYGPADISASVIAENWSPDLQWAAECGDDPEWTPRSLGHNLLGQGCLLEPEPTDLLADVGPEGRPVTGLGPLQDNGGFSGWPGDADDDVLIGRDGIFEWEADDDHPLTHAPIGPGSPVVDVVSDGCPQTDQRQVPRPVGTACDIGAVEYVETLADLYPSTFNVGGVPIGDEFTFEARVRTNGPDDFVSAEFSVTLPAAITYVSDDGDCAYDAPVLTCTVTDDSLAVNVVASLPLTTTPGIHRWDISLLSSATHDPNPHNHHTYADVLAYEATEPDPEPGADEDGDGVHDSIDSDPLPPTVDHDGPGSFQHGATFGHIRERSGHTVFVQPDPALPDPEDSRVLISVTPAETSTGDRSVVDACGFVLRLPSPSGAIVRCGSLYTEILEGLVEIELPNGAIVSIPDGVTAFIQDNEDGSFTIEHRGGTSPIVVTPAGGTPLPPLVPGGEPIVLPALTTDPDPDPPVDPCKNDGKKDKGKNDKSKSSDKSKNDKSKDSKPKATKTEKPKSNDKGKNSSSGNKGQHRSY